MKRVNPAVRSEEHTSELQSLRHLVCRLLLEKTNTTCCCPSAFQSRRTWLERSALTFGPLFRVLPRYLTWSCSLTQIQWFFFITGPPLYPSLLPSPPPFR